MTNPRVFAIVVTFNGDKWYDRCFSSLSESEIPVETIVVDNASCSESLCYLKQRFPSIHLIENGENLGFAKANNIGIRYALDHGADFVFLLNQDAWVEKNTISALIDTFSDCENTGIAVPMQMNGSYSGLDDCFAGYLSKGIVSDLYMKHLQDYYVLPFVNAAAWMVRADCINQVGGFDTLLFFHYGEDENYCQRVRYHKYNLVLNTRCSFCHDREFRQGHEKEYRERMMSVSPYIKENLMYGDINQDFDINSLIGDQVKSLCLAFFSLSLPKIRKHKKMIEQLRKIKQSRAANMAGGLVWL